MQVAVIGGGVIGVCTAYFLAASGHEVIVIERYGNVAQEASFGNAGIVSTAYALPWAMPGMPKKLLSYLFKPETPVLLKKKLDPALWRWIRRWMNECEPDRFRANRERTLRLSLYSQEILRQVREHHELDYEQTSGVLQVFRTQQDLELARPLLDLLGESDMPHRLVEAEEARRIEPALGVQTALAGALHLPRDESGNCPLFTRQIKSIAQEAGVEFLFNSRVESLHPEDQGISFLIAGKNFRADAVVVAAGVDSLRLLSPLGVQVPAYPVKTYSASAAIKNFDQAPLGALIDETYKVAVTRLGSRIRVAGVAELGTTDMEMNEAALRTLVKVGEDWFPDAANYNASTFWCGTRPTLPDGPPLIGATPVKNLYINIGHGPTGWAMAAGSGKAVADIVSGHSAEIDTEGLTYSRYR